MDVAAPNQGAWQPAASLYAIGVGGRGLDSTRSAVSPERASGAA
jgi:hypothetical protein